MNLTIYKALSIVELTPQSLNRISASILASISSANLFMLHTISHLQQPVYITFPDIRKTSLYFLGRPVPPFQCFEFPYRVFIETLPYRSGGNTADYRIRWHVLRNNGTGGYDCPIADVNTSHNHRFIAYPHIVAYHDVTFVVPSRCHVRFLQIPVFIKEREGVSG